MGTIQDDERVAGAEYRRRGVGIGQRATLPVFARNVLSMTSRLQAIDATAILSQLRPPGAAARGQPAGVPAGAPVTRKLSITPNMVEAHALDLRSCSRRKARAWSLRAWRTTRWSRRTRAGTTAWVSRSATVQVTNLGVSVKDSPRSTLVFVTRLDNAAPVAGARVTIVGSANQTLWTGNTGADGVAIAPALPLRPLRAPWPLFVVTAQKDGDLAFVSSDWQSDPQSWRRGYPTLWSPAPSDAWIGVHRSRRLQAGRVAVRVKAVLRADDAAGAVLVAPNTEGWTVRVRDSRGSEVNQRTVVVGPWGAVDWEWQVPANAGRWAGPRSRCPPTRVEHGADRNGAGGIVSRRGVPRARLPRGRDARGRRARDDAGRDAARRRRSDVPVRKPAPIAAGAVVGGRAPGRSTCHPRFAAGTRRSVSRSDTLPSPESGSSHSTGGRHRAGGPIASMRPDGCRRRSPPNQEADAAFAYQFNGDVEGESCQRIRQPRAHGRAPRPRSTWACDVRRRSWTSARRRAWRSWPRISTAARRACR